VVALAAVSLTVTAPVRVTYPGVYVEEVPGRVGSIIGVSTSVTAFVGAFSRGPLDEAVQVFSFQDFKREFGGLAADSEASYAVYQFFLNGGSQAWVVRTAGDDPAPTAAFADIQDGSGGVAFEVHARSPGAWGNLIRVRVHDSTSSPGDRFDLVISLTGDPAKPSSTLRTEEFLGLSVNEADVHYVKTVVNETSRLIRIDGLVNGNRPAVEGSPQEELTSGADGSPPATADLIGEIACKTGIHALDDVDLFNILCIPRLATMLSTDARDVIAAAIDYCEGRKAFFIIDPPGDVATPEEMKSWVKDAGSSANAAVYYPRMRVADPLDDHQFRSVGPSGTIAGLYARTDVTRGVWKAAAGTEAALVNVSDLEVLLTNGENGILNSLGINCLRDFPVIGIVCWGARTLAGNDQMGSEWRYVPVRRLALFIEESLIRGTQSVALEPNDETLWAQIRLNVGAFMHSLFRQGAFQGSTPKDAYFVKCDAETTTQSDIDQGIVSFYVGFAPLKPAEFSILKIDWIAAVPTTD